ncbi:MAG: glycosyltransferase family 2 protein [Gammaproteobacteria bacterium]|nr:glycosyltransferase family 2 protein [Gammaproteobacteria bacterium]
MNDTISIVIPTFNRATLLPRAIDSALAQTVPTEVIVCDHGSSDATPAVAARYGRAIRYLRRERDQGPIVCWRDGIENARGALVHINFDDDWIDAAFLARTRPLLRADVAFVYTRARIHQHDGEATRVLMRHPSGIRPVAPLVQYLLREKLPISPGCALFRRKDLLKNLLDGVPGAHGIYGRNSGVGEDLLLYLLTTLEYPNYAHLPEALAHFLAHPSSITTAAGNTGKMGTLARAYALAKEHYLRQPGSLRPPRGLAAKFGRWRWKLAGSRSA